MSKLLYDSKESFRSAFTIGSKMVGQKPSVYLHVCTPCGCVSNSTHSLPVFELFFSSSLLVTTVYLLALLASC